MLKRWLKFALLAVIVFLAVAQFFPPDRTNPPSDPAASFAAVARPSPETAAVIERSCRNCHSNQTVWPWYSRVAPASWLVVSDVREGRAALNFSEWKQLGPEKSLKKMRKACEEAKSGEMPPWQYTLLHRDAKLDAAGVQALCAPATAPAR
jgi:hypothetical protein